MSTTPTGTSRRSSRTRLGRSVAAAAVVGAVLLPLGALPSEATTPVAAAKPKPAKPGFSGYSTTAVASPIKVEIYEPTIPIPATPQAELSFGYSSVGADSSSARARSSYLWPGASVGEGFKTIIENLGLPPELSGPLGDAGYPVQVNAVFPGGPDEDSDEPLPGSIQRASAGENQAVASTGFSTDSEVKDDDGDGGDGGDGGGDGPLPGLPGLPELVPGLPGLGSGLGVVTDGVTGGVTDLLGSDRGTTTAAPDSPSPAPGLPPELAALVDVGGFSSVSKTVNGDLAFSQSRSTLTDITLLGGLVTVDAVSTVARTTSDGAKGVAEGQAEYGDIVAFGQRFRFGPHGYEAVGQAGAIPGLPDQATKALQQLGLTITVPQALYEVDGDAAESTVPGLVLEFDLAALKTQLSALPLSDLIDAIPAEAGELKSLLQAATNLSPRIVFTLGLSTSSVDTSQPLPPVQPTDPEVTPPPTEEPQGSTGGGTTGGGTGGAGTTPPPADAPGGATPSDDSGDLAQTAAAQQPGLPTLFSIPTLLFLLGLGLAGVAGTFARRMGLAVLGGSAACSHGLDSGLPDLRKVQ